MKITPNSPKSGRIQSGIALFETQKCTFVENTGASVISRLPFNVEAAWSLKCGVLVERRILTAERRQRQNQTFTSSILNDTSAEPHALFTIFLMSHPLDEMSPVLIKTPGAKDSSCFKLCFANDENQKIVGVVSELGLVVTISKASGLHSLWYLEKARVEDYAHLYLMDEEGRITVAPEALAATYVETSTVNPKTPVVSTPVDVKNSINQITPNRCRFQHLSVASSPFLSPFRASLEKLKELAKSSAVRRRDSFLLDLNDDDISADSSQPMDLDEHIRRLSAVSFLPPKRFGFKDSADVLQTPVDSSRQKINSKATVGGLPFRSRSRKNSVCKAYTSIPGIFATSSHLTPHLDGSLGEDVDVISMALDEPLLPKVSLSLIWTEKLEDQLPYLFPATPNREPCINAIGDTPKNPRVAILSGQPQARSSLAKGLLQQSQQTHSPFGPHRPRVFLARDLIDRCYVCLLNGRQRLVCLSVREVTWKSDGKDSGDKQFELDTQVTYLPALDAVYVPESKLTVCLDPTDSIILYSGITQICILGVLPALVSPVPSSEGLNSSNLRPLSILPSKLEGEILLANTKITDLLSSINQNCADLNVPGMLLQENLGTSISHLYPIHGTSQGDKSELTWRLCLPVGDQFTLALMKKPLEGGDVGDEVCQRELQIHLPSLANVTIVQHCLSSLSCGLPDETALDLLRRWYCYSNPPNASDNVDELTCFARFILTILGLIPEDESLNKPASMETDVDISTKRLKDSEVEMVDIDIIHQLLNSLEAHSGDLKHLLLRHLPDVLLCLHLVIENDQLDTMLVEQVKFMASLNHIIAMYARFSSYVEYYSTSGLSTLTPNDLACIPQLHLETINSVLYWSSHARSACRSVPSLNRYSLSMLSAEVKNSFTPYLYLPGVNDTATTLATFVICAQSMTEDVDFSQIEDRDILRFWSEKISLVGYEKGLDKEIMKNPIVRAFIATFLKTALSQFGAPALRTSYQRALVFLSELGAGLTKKLSQMPTAFASIIHSTMVKCLANPPPNCSPHVYQIIGRHDIARQFEIMRSSRRGTHKQKLAGQALRSNNKTGGIPSRQWDEITQERGPADRWFGLVRPILTNPSTDGMVVSRHFLLSTLENSPACQVAFDDLRLQEAYKMLQTTSHIWLPRTCTDESTFGANLYKSGNSNSNLDSAAVLTISKVRLDMQLGAAGVRTSALPLGRGMLGLGTIVSSPPPLLTVYPICLRGRSMPSSAAIPQQHDLAKGTLLDIRRGAADTPSGFAASDTPANATALAILSAVVATGCASSLKTACSLSRMMTSSEGVESPSVGGENQPGLALRRLMSIASNATLSATSAVSSGTIIHSPSVMAGQHWPEFHNGVAAGLMISPQTSIDATWIVQNYKAIALGASTNMETLNATSPSACPYSPAQAGFLYGLGLNGHLNKLTPHYIREFTIQVHDLTNAAVMLGLCAGKSGSMDQGVLRLLAVHYRPLLMPEPVLVDMSVPSLCQAAAAFGLGLLFKGSAHRHIANILLTELGRPLSTQQTTSTAGNAVITNDANNEGGNNNDAGANDPNANNDVKFANAGGSGGFAGEARELISLSAGFALGLVLLQRGETSSGLSDLSFAHILRAYMTGDRRDSTVYHLDAGFGSLNQTVDVLCIDIPRPPSGYPLEAYLQPHLLASTEGRSRLIGSKKPCPRNTYILATPKVISEMSKEELADLGVTRNAAKSISLNESTALVSAEDPLDQLIRDTFRQSHESKHQTPRDTPVSPRVASTVRGGTGNNPQHQQRQRTALIGQSAILNQSQQIRERDTYNSDVSAPGATIALGFAYLGTGNATISGWLKAPNSFRELEMVRPDILTLRTISWGLVNFGDVVATAKWIEGRLPACIVKILTPASLNEGQTTTSSLVMSTETDVENRGPRGRVSSSECKKSSRSIRQPLSPKLPVVQLETPYFLPESLKFSSIDFSTVAQAYLNILVGASFVIGLKYAGTCDSEASELLHKIIISILTSDWWPPNRNKFEPSGANVPPRLLDLPPMEQSIRHAAATVLTALAMVLAGSGNLTVLRMVRKLRSIRFFGHCPQKVTVSKHVTSTWPSPAETARLFQVAAAVAQTIPNVQPSGNINPTNQPVSTAAVLGSVLGPDFGLQMVYGSVVGLLFLGGGRLTLSNSPEAAALLTIAFFPRFPIYAGDNWYHLQCLRHLYVLATKPRRLCGVNVLTNQVEQVNLKYWYKDKNDCYVSKRTAVFTSDFWERGSRIQLSCGKVTTSFDRDTAEWNLLKRSLHESGFFFVTKEPFPSPYTHFLKNVEVCLLNWTNPSQAWQLRMMANYLKSERHSQNSSENVFASSGALAQALTTRLTQQFLLNAKDIQKGLQVYFFGSGEEKRALPSGIRAKTTSFRIWFSISSARHIRLHLPTDGRVSLSQFLVSMRPIKDTVDKHALYWLYKLLYQCS
nr:anaphase promoting complex subunit 1 [Hymenolepis microstoma]